MNGFGDPFHLTFAKIGQFERIADQTAGRGCDDDLVGDSQSLQTRRQIGRAAHRQPRLAPHTGLLTDDDRTGGDADTDRQVLGGRYPFNCGNDLQRRPDGTLGVFFVRYGPAEIRQDAITDVARDEPVVARNDIAAVRSIRVQ
jgi:hypothetical protein